MVSENNLKTYQRAIKGMRELITERYPDGGWLPGGRGMAEQLGVSHSTYRKAIGFLEAEGVVRSYPKKGHYAIPGYLCCKKIGVIVGDGSLSPFIPGVSIFNAALGVLEREGYEVQIIQAMAVDQLYDSALVYGLKGLIWFSPPLTVLDEVKKLSLALPLIMTHSSELGKVFTAHLVTYDTLRIAGVRARFMLERGHKNIAYIGSYGSPDCSGMLREFRAASVPFTKTHCIPDPSLPKGAVTALIRAKGITGIISGGGQFIVGSLFEELAHLSGMERPEVLVSHFPMLDAIHRRTPEVKLLKLPVTLKTNPGEAAATILLEYLVHGKPLRSMALGLVDLV